MNNEELSLKLDFILLPEKFGPLPQPRAGINEFASHIIVVVPYITPFTLKVHTHTHTHKKKSFLKVPSLLQILVISFLYF